MNRILNKLKKFFTDKQLVSIIKYLDKSKTKCIKVFEKNAKNLTNETHKKIYPMLIERIFFNIWGFDKHFKVYMLHILAKETDLNRLAAIYKITKDLDNGLYKLDKHPWAKKFLDEKDIRSFKELWEDYYQKIEETGWSRIEYSWLRDLLEIEIKADIDWVKISKHDRLLPVNDIHKEFNFWVLNNISNLIKETPYNLENYLSDMPFYILKKWNLLKRLELEGKWKK